MGAEIVQELGDCKTEWKRLTESYCNGHLSEVAFWLWHKILGHELVVIEIAGRLGVKVVKRNEWRSPEVKLDCRVTSRIVFYSL
jgi:hypothetical protein